MTVLEQHLDEYLQLRRTLGHSSLTRTACCRGS